MDLDEAIALRRMNRRFADRPIAGIRLRAVIEAGFRAPSAGFAQGVDFLVLEEAAARQRFWELASDRAWRDRVGGSAAGLLPAPAIVLPLADPQAYVDRYGAPDKSHSNLHGVPAESWPVPYWLVDASFATMLILLAATNEGLGALFFRLHRETPPVLAEFGVPAGRIAIGAIALGWPIDAANDVPTDAPDQPDVGTPARLRPTSKRSRRHYDERVHLDGWRPATN